MMPSRHCRLVGAIISIAAICAIGCSKPTASSCLDTTSVTVSVGAGTKPVVSWSPACLAGFVGFETLVGGDRFSMFESYDASNRIPSGRAYGDGLTPKTTFVSGATYRVTVGYLIGGDAIAVLGTLDFVP